MFYKNEKLALFVDGPNFYHTARALDLDVDYKRLLADFRQRGHLVRASYFTPLAETDENIAVKPLLDWMAYNGWAVVTKPMRPHADPDGRPRTRGNADIEMVVHAVQLAEAIDHAVLFTGNSDFLPLVRCLQDCGRRVTVASSIKTQPAMVSDRLRRQADAFIDLDSLRESIARTDRDGLAA